MLTTVRHESPATVWLAYLLMYPGIQRMFAHHATSDVHVLHACACTCTERTPVHLLLGRFLHKALVAVGVVFYWRGAWYLLDDFVFPGNMLKTSLATIAIWTDQCTSKAP